jgi:hydroxymethylglutaryl-CoA lyase
MAERVRITDVSPRDGLQNEPGVITTADKVRLVELLCATGVDEVEVSSFVSAKWVPQLGDAAEVFAGAAGAKRPGLEFSALVPNEKGMEALLGVNATSPLVDKVCLFTAASETFNKKNTNATIAESFERFAPVLRAAWRQQLAVKIYISCAFGCPFEGEVSVGKTVDTVRMALAALAPWLYRDEGPGGFGDTEVSISDTIGVATPGDIHKVMKKAGPDGDLEGMWVESRGARPNLHLHDTFGRAAACVRAGLESGVRSFDGSAAGLGGCPYASTPGKRAPGNINTELLVKTVEAAGFDTGVDLAKLSEAGAFASQIVAAARAAGG